MKKSGITETDLKNYISDFKARDSRLDSINKIIIALILVPIAAAIIQSNSEIISLIIAITFFISFLTILFFMAYTLINLDQIQLNKQRISIFKEVLTYFDDNYDDKYIEKEASSNWQFVGINIAILVVIGGALIAFGHYYLNLISDHKEYIIFFVPLACFLAAGSLLPITSNNIYSIYHNGNSFWSILKKPSLILVLWILAIVIWGYITWYAASTLNGPNDWRQQVGLVLAGVVGGIALIPQS